VRFLFLQKINPNYVNGKEVAFKTFRDACRNKIGAKKEKEGIPMRSKDEVWEKGWLCLFAVLAALSFMFSTANADGPLADLVLMNGKVVTVDKIFSIKEAVAVKGDRIRAVGTNGAIRCYISEGTKIIDLKGKTVLPGINDSHGHATSFGAALPPISLVLGYPTVHSIADIQAALAARVAEVPEGHWIRGQGWDPAFIDDCAGIENECLNKSQLDLVSPNNPVIFIDFSYHNCWVNSKALELAGIDRNTPDPPGGVIERDSEGNPTGIFRELSALGLVMKAVPLFTKEELREACLTAMKEMNKNGITSYTEAALGPGGDTYNGGVLGEKVIEVYKDLYHEDKLTARISILLLFGEYGAGDYESLKNGVETYDWPEGYDPKWLRFPGIKIFADGIPPTKTAWMWDEYIGGGYGSLTIPGATDEEKVEELTKMIVYGHSMGFQVPVHATGDRAISTVVDAYEEAMRQYPSFDRRHYVIHGDFISPEDCSRLASMGFGVNMQPYIQTIIADIEPFVVGPERAAYEWPFKTALDAGIPLTFSSDLGVTYPNWRQGVQSAITREGVSGVVSGYDEIIGRKEAIRAYTINGAWQDFMENEKGSIEPGKLADFCVLDRDIMTAEAHTIGNINVVMTIVGGKIVYDAAAE
jgi:predicted amidohydrolase YtcJ